MDGWAVKWCHKPLSICFFFELFSCVVEQNKAHVEVWWAEEAPDASNPFRHFRTVISGIKI